MPIADYCGGPVRTATPDESLRTVARRMDAEDVGALVVVTSDRVAGVVTDRDVALAVLARRLDADDTAVEALLGRDPVLVPAKASLRHAASLLRRARVRRLPVVDERGGLVGMLSADDLLRLTGGELGGLAKLIARQGPATSSPVPLRVQETLLLPAEAE